MDDVTELPAELEVRARGAAYLLLADLLARGPVDALLEPARMSETMADALASYPTLDDARADHQDAFGFNVPPIMGAFLDHDAQAGGESAQRVATSYAVVGYAPNPRGEEPEHLATLLRALGVLSGAEVDAIVDGEDDVVAQLRRLQRELLEQHVLEWLPLFVAAVERLEETWPNALVHQLGSLIELHSTQLRTELVAYEGGVPFDLDDPDTDLRTIARALSAPARCGIWLSKHDLKHLGRKHRLPQGFGSRVLTLQNLFRSAVRFEALSELVDDLCTLIEKQEQRLEPGHPAIARCSTTRELLLRIASEGVSDEEDA